MLSNFDSVLKPRFIYALMCVFLLAALFDVVDHKELLALEFFAYWLLSRSH